MAPKKRAPKRFIQHEMFDPARGKPAKTPKSTTPKPARVPFGRKPGAQRGFEFAEGGKIEQRKPSLVGHVNPTFGKKRATTYEIHSFDPGTSQADAAKMLGELIASCKRNGLMRIVSYEETERAVEFLKNNGFHPYRENAGGHGREDARIVYVRNL